MLQHLLENFARSCGVTTISKSIFPYEKWNNAEAIINCEYFPPYSDFISSLVKPQSPEVVEEFVKVAVNKFEAGEWSSMKDIENYYGFELGGTDTCAITENGEFHIDDHVRTLLQSKLHTCPGKYEASKSYFGKNCYHMMEYLQEYNLLDCRIG